MESASARSAAAAKPQSQSPSPPMAKPDPGRPPMAMTTAELEATIAALPAKKDTLREAFDRLAACSPFPLPFTWDDLDAHISSLQSSISLRFRQLQVLEAARLAPAVSAAVTTGDDENGKNQEEEEASEEEEEASEEEEEASAEEASAEEEEEEEVSGQEEEEEEASAEEEEEEEVSGQEVEEEEEADEENQKVEEEEQEADEEMQESKEEADEPEEEEQEADDPKEEEQEVDEEMQEVKDEEAAAKKASSVLDEEADEEEQQEAKKSCPGQDIEEEEEKDGRAKKVYPEQGNPTLPGGGKVLMVACARMDAPRLVELVCKSVGIRQEFAVAMRHAPDAAALVLCVVRGFLHCKEPKTAKVWGNCVGLIRCVPEVTRKLSAHMMERAKRLAKDWKEMIDKSGSCGDLGILASWGLLYFLISYNIVSEFDADEIIRIFGTVPRKHQKKNSIELCKGLGLVSRITDLIDYLIGNGQLLDAVQLTHVFNLVDKYPPVSLLEGYVEKAKETALEIFSKKVSPKSLNPAILKEVDNLRVAQNIIEQQSTDSSQCSVIFAEIKNLLAEYAKMRSHIKASTASTSNSQQQQKIQQKQQQQKQKPHDKQQKQKQKNKKRKKEQQEHEQQGQRSKLQGKQEQQQSKQHDKHQQQQQNKLQGKQGQQQHKPQKKLQHQQQQNEQQERQQQHLKRPRPCITKLPTPVIPTSGVLPPVVPNVAQIGPLGHSPYAVMPGIHTYPVIQGRPFAPNVGAPQYMGLFNPYQLNPLYRHPSFYPR